MISGTIPWERSFFTMTLAMHTTGLLLQLLLLGTTNVVAQVAIEPTQPPPPPPPPQPSETMSIILSTISTRSTTHKATVTTRTTTTTTTDFIECDIRKSGPSGGAIAGIVIGVLIVYIVSLILVAILASVLTKRGTIDLSRWKIFRVASNGNNDKASKDSNTELAEPNDYTDEMHSSSAGGVYAALDGRTRVETPAEPSPYEALQMHGGHKNRNAKKKPRIKKKPTSTVPQETDEEKQMATVPQEATDDEIYQNY